MIVLNNFKDLIFLDDSNPPKQQKLCPSKICMHTILIHVYYMIFSDAAGTEGSSVLLKGQA